MTRAAALLGLLLIPFQEPPSEFARLLEAAERSELVVPGFLDAVAKLDALRTAAIPLELAHRHQTLRAQAAVFKSLHNQLTLKKGESVDMPIAGGKTALAKIIAVTNDSVTIKRPEFVQTLKFGELDPEWSLTLARPEFGSNPEASLWAGLWLAKAARWDAAFRELRTSKSDHPLAIEARRRGLDGLLKQAEAALAGKRWKEALERLAAAETSAPGDGSVAAARQKLVDAIVEQAKEHSRKGSKKAMEDLIDFIILNFPGREAVVEAIREESRWITITDPKKFGLTGKDGSPILLDPGEKRVLGAYVKELAGKFDGISVRIRFTKVSKESHGGPIWMGKDGRMHPWVIRDDPLLMFARLDEKASQWMELGEGKVEPAETYDIRALLENGEFAISVNGREILRKATGETEIQSPGIQASHGRLTFDRFRLRKKP